MSKWSAPCGGGDWKACAGGGVWRRSASCALVLGPSTDPLGEVLTNELYLAKGLDRFTLCASSSSGDFGGGSRPGSWAPSSNNSASFAKCAVIVVGRSGAGASAGAGACAAAWAGSGRCGSVPGPLWLTGGGLGATAHASASALSAASSFTASRVRATSDRICSTCLSVRV